MRAIISVANHDGLIDLARELQSHHVSILATTKTMKALTAAGIHASSVGELSRMSEALGEHVSVLHPAIIGGIVARRDMPRHETELSTYGIEPIDLVAVNLLPFSEAVSDPTLSLQEALDRMDIGGITLMKAAAKNFQDVVVLMRPQDYAPTLQEWREQGEVSLETKRRLAATAFQYATTYDAAVAEYLRSAEGELFPEQLTLSLELLQNLRYGENPHQQAAFYRWSGYNSATTLPTIADAHILQGRSHAKLLSYNDWLNLDAALKTVQYFTAPAVAIVKHTNPCGLGCDDVLVAAYKKAHAGDPVAAAGGVIGCNRPVDRATALEILPLFYTAVIAPEYTPEALELLRKKPEMRLLATYCPIEPRAISTQTLREGQPEIRSVSGGLLLQTPDIVREPESEYSVVTEREPTLEEVTNLMFAWKAVHRVMSNAVVLASKLMLVGIGAGQTSRVASVQLAVEKAGARARGSILASDAVFPFPDGIATAAKAGVTAIIQPGGAERDEEIIRAANHYAMAMIFTGRRHYRH
jgi:phosphoribosylaminoimidazolecarboxamide formyltransferase / IMP cyclohydrolase